MTRGIRLFEGSSGAELRGDDLDVLTFDAATGRWYAAAPSPGGSGLAPLAVLEAATLAFWDTTQFDGQVGADNLGAFVECAFGDWSAGDLLCASYWLGGGPFTPADPLMVYAYVAVSLDAGATWQQLATTQQAFISAAAETASVSLSGSASIALPSAPLVRIGYRSFTATHFKNDADLGASLRCERYAPSASYVPSGRLIATP